MTRDKCGSFTHFPAFNYVYIHVLTINIYTYLKYIIFASLLNCQNRDGKIVQLSLHLSLSLDIKTSRVSNIPIFKSKKLLMLISCLWISGDHSDSEESSSTGPQISKSYNPKQFYSKFTYSSQSTPTRRFHDAKSTRSSSTASENKVLFNEGKSPFNY